MFQTYILSTPLSRVQVSSGQPVPLAEVEAVDEEEEEEREFEQQLSQWKKTEVRQRAIFCFPNCVLHS